MSVDQYSSYGAGTIAGAVAERERIIKILKTNFINNELLDLAVTLIEKDTE